MKPPRVRLAPLEPRAAPAGVKPPQKGVTKAKSFELMAKTGAHATSTAESASEAIPTLPERKAVSLLVGEKELRKHLGEKKEGELPPRPSAFAPQSGNWVLSNFGEKLGQRIYVSQDLPGTFDPSATLTRSKRCKRWCSIIDTTLVPNGSSRSYLLHRLRPQVSNAWGHRPPARVTRVARAAGEQHPSVHRCALKLRAPPCMWRARLGPVPVPSVWWHDPPTAAPCRRAACPSR